MSDRQQKRVWALNGYLNWKLFISGKESRLIFIYYAGETLLVIQVLVSGGTIRICPLKLN